MTPQLTLCRSARCAAMAVAEAGCGVPQWTSGRRGDTALVQSTAHSTTDSHIQMDTYCCTTT